MDNDAGSDLTSHNNTVFGLLLFIAVLTFLIMSVLIYNNEYNNNMHSVLWILVALQMILFASGIAGVFMNNKWLAILMFISQYVVTVITLVLSSNYQNVAPGVRTPNLTLGQTAIPRPNSEMSSYNSGSLDPSHNALYIVLHNGALLTAIFGIFTVTVA